MASAPGQVLFVSTLKDSSLEKAKKELFEEPENRDGAIQKLRESILEREASSDPELEGILFERKDNGFLLRFLRARKFNQERALELYINYYRCRRDYPKVFDEFVPQSVKELYETGALAVLDHPARDGSKVICIQPRRIDVETVSSWLILRMMLLVMEKLLEDEETQVHGVRVMVNYDEVEFLRVWKFSQMETTKNGVMPKILQDAMPLRLKGIHLVKQPWYISIVLTILKSFMKEKMKERLNFHGFDFVSLNETFYSEHLPSDFDGPLSSLDEFNAIRLFDFHPESAQVLSQDPAAIENADSTTETGSDNGSVTEV